jgi:HSP20 family protein
MATPNDTQQQDKRPPDQQSRPQQKVSDSASSTDTSARKSTSGSTEMAQRIPTTSEVAARRPSLFNAGRLVTPWELMRRMNAELDRLVGAVEMQRNRGASSRMNTSDGAANDGGSVDDLTRVDWIPRIEVVQADGAMVVRAELPGLKPDDIVVNVENGVLSIWGERRQEQREQRDGAVRTERVYGTFLRSIPLPDGADEDQVTATFRDGVLELTIPVTERDRGRRITVQS